MQKSFMDDPFKEMNSTVFVKQIVFHGSGQIDMVSVADKIAIHLPWKD